MYRTAEQDERLNDLYTERDRLFDYAEAHPTADISLALKGVDDEIEFLTAGIGEMPCPKCAGKAEPQDAGTAVAVLSGTADLSLNDMTLEQQKKWWAGIEPMEF